MVQHKSYMYDSVSYIIAYSEFIELSLLTLTKKNEQHKYAFYSTQ